MFEAVAFRPLLHIPLQMSSLSIVHAFINIYQSHVTLWSKTKKYNIIFCISVYMNGTTHLIIHDQVYICLFFLIFRFGSWHLANEDYFSLSKYWALSCVCACTTVHRQFWLSLSTALEDQRSGCAGLLEGFFFSIMQTLDSQGKKTFHWEYLVYEL